MEFFDDIKLDHIHSNDRDSLREQIEKLGKWNQFLENELTLYRRRAWLDFESMVSIAHILVKLEKAFPFVGFQ